VKKEHLQGVPDHAEKELFSAERFAGFVPTSKQALIIKTLVRFALSSANVERSFLGEFPETVQSIRGKLPKLSRELETLHFFPLLPRMSCRKQALEKRLGFVPGTRSQKEQVPGNPKTFFFA